MRRNNGWLAILAVSMVLPILRHGLAGERLPLDYGNTNGSKSAYDARFGPDRPTSNAGNRESESFATKIDDGVESSASDAIPYRGSRSDARTTLSEIGESTSTKKSTFSAVDSRKRADKSTETEILDASRDSWWFFGGAIKNRSWRTNDGVRRRQKQEPKSLGNGTSTGNQLVSFAYRYYGHVNGRSPVDSTVDREKRDDRNAVNGKTLEEAISDAVRDASLREIKGNQKTSVVSDHRLDNDVTDNAGNELFDEREEDEREITGGSKLRSKRVRSVYNMMNNQRAVKKSMNISGLNDNEDIENSTNTDESYFSLDFELNRTNSQEHSSDFEDSQLKFNESTVAPLENETLSEQFDNQISDDTTNSSIDPDLSITFSNNEDNPSIVEESLVSSILDRDSLNQSYVDSDQSEILYKNITNDHEENNTSIAKNGSLIPSTDIFNFNISNDDYIHPDQTKSNISSYQEISKNIDNLSVEERIMEPNFPAMNKSEGVISPSDIPRTNSSNQDHAYSDNNQSRSNQDRAHLNQDRAHQEETPYEEFKKDLEDATNNNTQELDITFGEGNVSDNSIKWEEAIPNAAKLNGGKLVTVALMYDNEVESNNEARANSEIEANNEIESNCGDTNETDTTELNATWNQLNEHGKAAKFKATQKDSSAAKDVTKETELFVVSPVESLVQSSTYPSTEIIENTFDESNNDTFQNLFTTSTEKWHGSVGPITNTEQSRRRETISSSNSEGTSNITNGLSKSLKMNERMQLDRSSSLTRFSGSSKENNVNAKNSEDLTKFDGSLDQSITASKEGHGVSPDQNAVEEMKNNEPVRRKNASNKTVASEDNGTVKRFNPTRKKIKDIEDERSTEHRVPDAIVDNWMIERFPKGRKSRSSRVSSTTSSVRSDSSKIVDETSVVTSNPVREADQDGNNAADVEPPLRVLENDPKTPTTSSRPHLVNENRSIASNRTQSPNRVIDHYWEAPVDENVTSSMTEFGVRLVDIDPSITAATGNEQRSFGFDVISMEEHANAEDGSYRVNNSSIEMEPLNQWPVKHSAVVEGDLVLGGLMMVHEREDTITCGPVMPQGGVQALEAMLYTLDRLNDREIVPGVKIGAHILDDCDKDTYGLEMAVDFIKGSISNIDGAEYHCNKTAVRKVISGVVGAASSVTSIQVANLLRLFRIPQVSFFSTSPELSNKQRFEYFTRTIPSDHYQVKAMIDIVLKMGWSYVSIIYEESNYGIKAFEELEELLGKHDICIAIKEKLVKDSGVAEETAYDNIVLKLLTKPRAKGCIIFGSDQEVAGVMRAVRRCNATGAFSWIGSDGWSARGLVSNGNEPEVEGTLSVQPQANPVKGFEEYFLNLTVENNRRNPWFVEFWEDHFQCRYPNASRTPYNKKYTKPCTTKERLTKQDTAFEDQLQFVSDAVMAFAYAFRDMHKDLCFGKPGLCDAMKPTKGTELLKYLRKVDFEGLSGDKFKFDKNGDGPARYNIIHFKQIEPGKYKWIRVGKYLEGELRLNMSEIQFKLGHPQPPESVCSLPCEVGQAKKYVEGERCCWHCFNCTQYQIRHPKDETQCIPCRQGTVPDETHSTCRDIPEEFLRPESGWAIGAMSFSAVGMMITLFVCGVFLKHNDTPVVRASGRELSYVLLSGILLCYLVTFALVLRPTDIVCGIQRFAAGFCFTVVYAALLTKTNRISRIFNASKHSAKRPSFISPRSQLIICSGLVFVQILINGVWMIIDPARAMHHYPTREDNLLVCNSYVDASYMIAFAYPIMLIVVCTVYAVLTRKIPEAFNESKHIGFTMYTTCVIWLAFVPLYFGTGNNVALRITSMSVTISLSASVTIACLFSPKLYIILIRPERNVRQSMMPARYSTTKSSAVTATNASSMIAPITLTAATCDQNKAVKKHIITTIDCSTQSEYYELEVKDRKNGKPPPTVVSRSTQTSGTNEKDSNAIVSSKDSNENTATTKQLNNNARIGNGPVNQSDVPL